MAAPKGHARYGGRKKGTPNRSTLTLQQKCDEWGLDPFSTMVRVASEEQKPHAKFDFCERIAVYLYPKRKPIESDHELDDIIIQDAKRVSEIKTLPVTEQIKMLEAAVKKLKGES